VLMYWGGVSLLMFGVVEGFWFVFFFFGGFFFFFFFGVRGIGSFSTNDLCK